MRLSLGDGPLDLRPGGPPTAAVQLVLDTLLLVPEQGRCTILWRGHCPVADLAIPEIETIVVRQRT